MQALLADYAALCTGFTNLEKYLLDLANEPFGQKLAVFASFFSPFFSHQINNNLYYKHKTKENKGEICSRLK
jgi:hypothetical protein